jgi:hypothetical protein
MESVANREVLHGEIASRLIDGDRGMGQGEKHGSKPVDVIG